MVLSLNQYDMIYVFMFNFLLLPQSIFPLYFLLFVLTFYQNIRLSWLILHQSSVIPIQNVVAQFGYIFHIILNEIVWFILIVIYDNVALFYDVLKRIE